MRELKWPGPFEIELIRDEASERICPDRNQSAFPGLDRFPLHAWRKFCRGRLVELLQHAVAPRPAACTARPARFISATKSRSWATSTAMPTCLRANRVLWPVGPTNPYLLPKNPSHEPPSSYVAPAIQRVGSEACNPFRLGSRPVLLGDRRRGRLAPGARVMAARSSFFPKPRCGRNIARRTAPFRAAIPMSSSPGPTRRTI